MNANRTVELTLTADPASFVHGVKAAEAEFAAGMRKISAEADAQSRRIDRAMAGIQAWRKLKETTVGLEGAWRQAQERVKQLAEEMGATDAPSKKLTSEFERAKTAAARAKEAFEAKREALGRLKSEIQGAAGVTGNLAAAQAALRQQAAGVAASAEAAKAALTSQTAASQAATAAAHQQATAEKAARDAHATSMANAARVHQLGVQQSESWVRGLTAQRNGTRDAAAGMDRLATSTAGTLSPLGGLRNLIAGIGMAALAKSVIDAGLAMERVNAILFTLSGSTTGAAREMAFVKREADALGLRLDTAAEAYGKFGVAANLSGMRAEQSRRIFHAVAVASSAMKLSSDETKGAFLALSQMISKGTVQAEELKGQLGERLPGAFALAAQAMRVSEQELTKMLEQGQVMAKDLLPALSELLIEKFGPAAEQAASGAQAGFNRFFNTLLEKKDLLAQEINPALAALGEELSKALNDPAVTAGIKNIGEGIAGLTGFLRDHGSAIVTVVGGYVALRGAMGVWGTLNAALAVNTGVTWAKALETVGASSTVAAAATGKLGDAFRVVGNAAKLDAGTTLGKWAPSIIKAKDAIIDTRNAHVALMTGLTSAEVAAGAKNYLGLADTIKHGLIPVLWNAVKAAAALAATPIGLAVIAAGALTVWMHKNNEELETLEENLKKEKEQSNAFAESLQKLKEAGVDLEKSGASREIARMANAVRKGSLDFEAGKRKVEAYTEALINQHQKRASLIEQITSKEKGLAELRNKLAEEEKNKVKEVLEGKKHAAEEALRAQKASLEEALRKEKEYAEAVKSSRKKLLEIYESGETMSRAAARKGMTPEQEQQDMSREVDQHLQSAEAARKRLEDALRNARNAEKAIQAEARKAERFAKMPGYEAQTDAAVGRMREAEERLRKNQEAAKALNDEMGKSGEAARNVGSRLTDVKQAQEAIAQGTRIMADAERGRGAQAQGDAAKQKEIVEAEKAALEGRKKLVEDFQQQLDKLKEDKTITIKAEIAQATAGLSTLQSELAALRDKEITITTRHVEAHAFGGIVGAARLARGGQLPGYGGGDRRLILAEDGEAVTRKEAVKFYGPNFMAALNAMALDPASLPRFATGGFVNRLVIPPMPAFATGGAAAGAGSPGQTIRIDLSFGGGQAFPVMADRDVADGLVRHLKRMTQGGRF
ncbi:MAG: tape measure protein [Magnetococcales bacterium]|nr:tape measure protein [Magnetococcales bacterium]